MDMLKKGFSLTLISLVLLSFITTVKAQVILQKDDFEPGPSNWTTNTTDVINGKACVNGGDNFWTINNSYNGNLTVQIYNTDPQPALITGSPNSNYLHIVNTVLNANGVSNANYYWPNPSNEQYMTKMNSSISTIGYNDVTFSFWWLNWANQDTSGQVLYSIDNGTTWIRTPNVYAGDSTWKKEDIKLPVFSGQAQLMFAFLFVNPDTGKAPSFAIDDVTITGVSSSVPTANFSEDTTKICIGDCVNFTDLSTGGPTAWSWDFGTGNVADTSDQQNPQFCFNSQGLYSITLKVSNSSGAGAPLVKANRIEVVDCNVAPQSQFAMNGAITNTITICAGDSIEFADSSSGSVDDRYWSFPGAMDTSGACRIVNDTTEVVTMTYPCAGAEGRDTSYTVTLNVSGLGGATFLTKRIIVKACVGPKSRLVENDKQKKACVDGCIRLEYDKSVEGENYISDKPTFKWYVWGIDTANYWDSIYVYSPEGTVSTDTTTKDTVFTDQTIDVCYTDSGAFRVVLVTENIYGKDSVVYEDYVSVYGLPVVDAIVEKPILPRGYSNELTTGNEELVANCRDLTELDYFNGDTSTCHNYYWSYKDITGKNITENINNWRVQTTRFRPESTTWYYVIRENFNGCRSFDSVLVTIDSTYNVGIPDIFSPGKNGSKNGSWYIFGNKITKIDVKVYNRFGQVVFETQEVSDIVWESDIAPVGAGWNGNRNNENGKELDPGVYTYWVRLFHETGEVKELSGSVTLVR